MSNRAQDEHPRTKERTRTGGHEHMTGTGVNSGTQTGTRQNVPNRGGKMVFHLTPMLGLRPLEPEEFRDGSRRKFIPGTTPKRDRGRDSDQLTQNK